MGQYGWPPLATAGLLVYIQNLFCSFLQSAICQKYKKFGYIVYLQTNTVDKACSLWTADRDHSAGNAEWKQRFTGIKIFGGAFDAVPGATEYVCAHS